MRILPPLYAIADRQFGHPVEIGRRLFAGGARLIQIRDKTASARSLVEQARALSKAIGDEGQVIINDRADVALVTGVAGVHLGQADLPAPMARTLLGPEALVGVSTHSLEQARAAATTPVDYVAFGPVFSTRTKAKADPVVGLEGLAAVCRSLSLPVVAIGGIRIEDVPAVLEAGAASVAVISDLLSGDRIEERTRDYVELLGRYAAT